MNTTVARRLASWSETSWVGSSALWTLQRIIFGLGLTLTAWVLYVSESYLFPVVSGFTVDTIIREDSNWVMEGTFRQVRNCELLNITISAVPLDPNKPVRLIGQAKSDNVWGWNTTRGLGTWGPWAMKVLTPPLDPSRFDSIEVRGVHKCHAFWNQETLYATFSPSRLP